VTFAHSTYRCGNYSREETIQGRKLFKGGNYSRAETIRGNTVYELTELLETSLDFSRFL